MEQSSKQEEIKYYVYTAVDVERDGIILMRVYTARNYLTTRFSIKEVLKYTARTN